MASSVKSKGRIPLSIWDKSMTKKTAEWMEELIYGRTFVQGEGVNDNSLKPNKTKTQPLVNTGNMKNSLSVQNVTDTSAQVAVTGSASAYSAFTEEDRPWLGVSPKDRVSLDEEISKLIESKMQKESK